MKIRIKYIKKNLYEGYYAVQVKQLLFWKTIHIDTVFANVKIFIDTLAKIDEFNSKTKPLNKIVYDGWAVRNIYKISGIDSAISFFKTLPHIYRTDRSDLIWEDNDGSIHPFIEIKVKELFGKEYLTPTKLRITIEQIEE